MFVVQLAAVADGAVGASTWNSKEIELAAANPRAITVTTRTTVVTGAGAAMAHFLQYSCNGGANWVSLAQNPNITATGDNIFKITDLPGGSLIRVQSTFGGTTPQFTRDIWLAVGDS